MAWHSVVFWIGSATAHCLPSHIGCKKWNFHNQIIVGLTQTVRTVGLLKIAFLCQNIFKTKEQKAPTSKLLQWINLRAILSQGSHGVTSLCIKNKEIPKMAVRYYVAFFPGWAIENDCLLWEGDWNALSKVGIWESMVKKERKYIIWYLSNQNTPRWVMKNDTSCHIETAWSAFSQRVITEKK